jgi:hypothetical protein
MIRSLSSVFVAAVLVAACAQERPARTVELTSGEAQSFPEADARTAIAAATHGLKTCKTPDGPQEMDATLRFEPTGKVSNVELAPFDPDVSPCVKKRLAEVEVRPFQGEAKSLRTRVKL